MGRRAVGRLAGVSRAPGFPSAPTYRTERGRYLGVAPPHRTRSARSDCFMVELPNRGSWPRCGYHRDW